MANEVEITVRTKDQTDFKAIRTRAVRESHTAGKDSSSGFVKSFRSAFTGMASSFFGNMATNATGIFSRAFGTAVSSNPYIGAGISAAVLGAVAVIGPIAGSALAGGIIGGLGTGLVGLGLFFAAKNKEVVEKWDKTTDHMSKKLTEISQPFVPVLLTGIDRIKNVFDTVLAPSLAGVFEKAAPAVDGLFASIEDGLKDPAVAKAIKDIGDAFVAIAEALTPEVADIISSLAVSIGDLATTVSDNPDLFVKIIEGIFNLVNAVIYALGYLYLFAGWFENHPNLANNLLIAFGLIMSAASAAVLVILGVKWAWDQITHLTADADIDISGFLGGVADAISAGARFAARVFVAALGASTGPLGRAISTAIGLGRGWASKVFRAVLNADWGGVASALRNAISQGRSWAGRVFTATFNVKKTVTSVFKSLIPGFASGGVRGAGHAAEGGPRGGLTLVGEQGPELLNLPAGSSVTPNGRTQSKMAGVSSSGGDTFIFQFPNYVGSQNDLMRAIRKAVRGEGGNVQKVLGT